MSGTAGARWARWARRAPGGAIGVLVAAGLAWSSQAPYRAAPEDAAEIRLAWRARVPLVEECRRLGPEELEAMPVHMRREEVCEGRVASYGLRVTVDGEVERESVVRPAGARGDRPLYVFESIPVAPGSHELWVEFVRLGVSGASSSGPAAAPPVPDRLVLRERVQPGSREVVLVVYDAGRRRLALRGGGGTR